MFAAGRVSFEYFYIWPLAQKMVKINRLIYCAQAFPWASGPWTRRKVKTRPGTKATGRFRERGNN